MVSIVKSCEQKEITVFMLYLHRKIIYRQTSNIRRTLVDSINADRSDVVGASPVGAAPTTSSFLA